MSRLSISTAWDESKAIIARDGRLFVSVALALVALPTLITSLLAPGGVSESTPLWADVLILVASLVTLAGQLALIRLALGPSVTVGGAVAHGLRRMPIYFASALIIVVLLLVLCIPFAGAMVGMGVPLDATAKVTPTPGLFLLALLYIAAVCFVGVRLLMAAPVASSEAAGPVAILRRSWHLTAGNWWRLFGFLLMFFIAAVALLIAVESATTLLASVLFGPLEPLSTSALLVGLVQAVANAVLTALFAVMLARIYAQLAGRGGAQATVPSSGI